MAKKKEEVEKTAEVKTKSTKHELFAKKLEKLAATIDKALDHADSLRGYLPKVKRVDLPPSSELARNTGFTTLQEVVEDLMAGDVVGGNGSLGVLYDISDRIAEMQELFKGESGFEL